MTALMYELRVSDHIMIAHSLPDPFFGPAQQLHGATYTVHAILRTPALNPQAVVVDIGEAIRLLKEVLSGLNYRNLDALPEFQGRLTTTEFLAAHIHQALADRLAPLFQGELCIRLDESPVASAGFTGPVPRP